MKRGRYFFLLTAALLILSLVAIAGAHMPGAREVPEVKLTPILIYDGDTLLEISIDDLAAYHGVRVGKGASKCVLLKSTYPRIEFGGISGCSWFIYFHRFADFSFSILALVYTSKCSKMTYDVGIVRAIPYAI